LGGPNGTRIDTDENFGIDAGFFVFNGLSGKESA
jgi:hypothetical protein